MLENVPHRSDYKANCMMTKLKLNAFCFVFLSTVANQRSNAFLGGNQKYSLKYDFLWWLEGNFMMAKFKLSVFCFAFLLTVANQCSLFRPLCLHIYYPIFLGTSFALFFYVGVAWPNYSGAWLQKRAPGRANKEFESEAQNVELKCWSVLE